MKKFLLVIFVLFIIIVFYKIFFYQKVKGVQLSANKEIKGLIIPHHDLAKDYIISTLSQLKKTTNPSTIFIVGPNHFNPTSNKFVSCNNINNYSIDIDLIEKLNQQNLTVLNNQLCQNDHSLLVPLFYLSSIFPQARFVPILAPYYFNKQDISNLANFLSTNTSPDTLFVASIDFSHGKSVIEGLSKNTFTENIIKSFDFQKLYTLRDDYLDSPVSLSLLLNIVTIQNARNWQLLYSSHSGFLKNNFSAQGTSYLIGVFFSIQ